MDMLLEFLYEHFGEIVLGLEFFLLSMKKEPEERKAIKLAKLQKKRQRLIEKEKSQTAKNLERAQICMTKVERLEKEE